MKLSLLSGIGACVVCTTLLSGCIDDNYDLSDIDTTTEVRIDNLVLPVNVDRLQLGSVIKLEDDDKIKVVDGKYAVLVDGDFKSDPISVERVTADGPRINPVSLPLIMNSGAGKSVYPIPSHPEGFRYHASNVDENIESIDDVTIKPMRIGISLSFPELYKAQKITIKNLKFKLPEGVRGTASDGSYDNATATLTVPEKTATFNGAKNTMDFFVNANEIVFNSANSTFNTNTHEFFFHGDIEILSGDIEIAENDYQGATPANATLKISYIFDNFTAETFSGDMQYQVENFDISPVDLNDLPDFLAQEGTNIIIGNPQIYLSLTNPLGDYGIYAQTGLTLTSERNGEPDKSFTLDNGTFTLGHNNGDGPYAYCFSPSKPDKYYEGYTNAEYEKFSSLGDVLSGNGLPKKIAIEANDPRFPRQHVSGFRLGTEIPAVEGSYTFFAPLNLEDGSSIVYTDSTDGWGGEDMDNLTIEHLEISMTVSTDINATVKLSGYPLDIDGNRIEGVSVEGADIPANAKDYPVTIHTTGAIKGLDGFEYTVYAAPGQSGVQLSPDQQIVLKNVRAKVSGKFVKEL